MFFARISSFYFLLLVLPLMVLGIPPPRHYSVRRSKGHHQKKPQLSQEPPVAPNKCPSCGRRPAVEEDRIVGGKVAGDYPWMAGLLMNDESMICGASLITKQYLLTAAHCVRNIILEEDKIDVVLGSKLLRNGTEESRQRIPVAEVIVHEKHQPLTLAHDIAILKLEKPAVLNSKVAPICLDMEDGNHTAKTAIATGWGKLQEDGEESEVLQEVELPIVPLEVCKEQYSSQRMTEDVVCAGEEGKDACQSDSGGPLAVAMPDGSWHLLGITSWGRGCARAGYPGVFVRVPSYLSWIAGKIPEDDCGFLSHLPTPPPPPPSKPNKDCKCGVPNRSDRIVGGYVTQPHAYPWQVALVERFKMIPFCGGALVSDLWVLTASHCAASMFLGDQVLLGMHDRSKHHEAGLVRRDVVEIVMHPKYGVVPLDNDIALLRLSKPVVLNQVYVAPVCLPAFGQKFDNGTAVVTGWGSVKYNGMDSKRLRAVQVPIEAHEICSNRYYPFVTKNMICAGLKEGGKDACQGDSGGPLVMDNGNGSYLLIGIVSWGIECAKPENPGVYANVANYVNWISEIIVGSEKCEAH
ncbi:transmembrane protease serine 9-like [Penaeus japonicus]|uniref:transmembrane protease serine 9-like n=1 Tax=Penaeus japonicus TaxID=27405 RepID=UPI001C7124BB|nr:transmembrane protease serine 9-like [Penaeus japonicus]